MVLTRAQRAQTKVTPPESPSKSGVLKAPVRRGRAKVAEAEEPSVTKETKTTKTAKTTRTTATQKPVASKDADLKGSLSRSASARTATTKASAARAATAKAAPTKKAATNTKATVSKTTAVKSAPNKPTVARKAVTAAKSTRAGKSAKQPEQAIQETDEPSIATEASAENLQVDLNQHQNEAGKEGIESAEQVVTAAEPAAVEATQPEQAEEAVPSSPTKLPRPVLSPAKPTSPFKMSLLSSSQGLGSVRKPTVSGALLASPAKPVFLAQAQTQTAISNGSPVRLNTSVQDFATVLGSPRRPGSSGSDTCSVGSAGGTPKRPHTEENVADISPKRLRTSMSMPSLGSPRRSQSSASGSPPSPAKSSLRSPVKRPGVSPKKVSWHQTPPRPVIVEQRTPPARQIGILDGCVFFLDVNSLTGVNQNSLFVGLIEELGGACIQEWSHNNMGITHVLFMNGEMRTLEKVLASNGEVYCVSLGWLLDCQRENIRIPESQPRYLIDLTHVPGHTPKPNRSALNTPMTSRTAAPVSHTPAIPPPKWALPTTPAVHREPLGALSSSLLIKTPSLFALKATPAPPPSVGMGTIDEYDKENVSPVSEATPLQQKTCPPKQFNRSILAMSTGISATPLRNKFLSSKRRRSLDGIQKPSVGGLHSPPRKLLGLGSPKRQTSPLKRSQFRP